MEEAVQGMRALKIPAQVRGGGCTLRAGKVGELRGAAHPGPLSLFGLLHGATAAHATGRRVPVKEAAPAVVGLPHHPIPQDLDHV